MRGVSHARQESPRLQPWGGSQEPGYEECLRACPGATAMFRLPLEPWKDADNRDRRILTAARALKRADSKKAAPSANQVYKACNGVYCKRYVEKTMRRIREQHLLNIENQSERRKPMSQTIPETATVMPRANLQDMLEGLLNQYLSIIAMAAFNGDRKTYQHMVKQLSDEQFVEIYFNHKEGKA